MDTVIYDDGFVVTHYGRQIKATEVNGAIYWKLCKKRRTRIGNVWSVEKQARTTGKITPALIDKAKIRLKQLVNFG